MRRKDREVSSTEDIIKIIEKCDVCRVAFSNDNIPYIVPMNFGFEYIDEKLMLYFHCAKQGRKLDMLAKNKFVGFEMDCSHKFVHQSNDNYTMEYESVTGTGIIKIAEFGENEQDEKLRLLNLLMKQYTNKSDYSFSDNSLNAVCILRLDVGEVCGKRNLGVS